MRILGIGLSHCCGVCLIEDERIVFAQEEDRFSRKRRHKGWPERSLDFLFREFGLETADIDLCVLSDIQSAKAITARIPAKRTVVVHHHLAHIMSGWALTGWRDFDCVSLDGGGDFGSWQSFASVNSRVLESWISNCGSALGRGNSVKRPFWRNWVPGTSLGAYWSAPSVFNFGLLDRNGIGGYEGKLMGLSALGRKERFDPRVSCYDAAFSLERRAGRSFIATTGAPKIGHKNAVNLPNGSCIPLHEVRRLRKQEKRILAEYDLAQPQDLSFAADFAAFLQDKTNVVLEELFAANFASDRPVVLSGGIFSNVVSNGLLNRTHNIFVVPPMGDEGLALGAAAWGAYLCGIRQLDSTSMLLGYDAGANDAVDPDAIAGYLSEKRVVGLINGRMELGPRALGARSILADPQDCDANHTINERLGRVEYMPFAPVILKEHAHEVLVGWRPEHESSKHMTLIYPVAEKWRTRLKGVVHVDGTVRPQVITREDHPLYYDILSAYHRLTGIPALINTSFNAHGEPILRTVEEGLEALKQRRVDVLIAGNKIHHA